MLPERPDCFTRFQNDISNIPLPERFTYPFHYEPHPLCQMAAAELQARLQDAPPWSYGFGMEADGQPKTVGKMFGVLLVQTPDGETGYLCAFSGKIGDENHYPGFVPPVFDILPQEGFFRKGEAALKLLNQEIERLENDPQGLALDHRLAQARAQAALEIQAMNEAHKKAKQLRDVRRKTASEAETGAVEAALVAESKRHHFEIKDLKRHWQQQISDLEALVAEKQARVQDLKKQRREGSAALQQQIFEQFSFLNIQGATQSLAAIFSAHGAPPPAGAGECAAPKLLQYAFLHRLRPLAMAEFWWGAPPPGEIREHAQYYPACRGKCAPILGHMLLGMPLDDNPLEQAPGMDAIEILLEDEHLLVLYKPPGMLSVPGKGVMESVYTFVRQRCPDATGPLIVHRLDMATSGVMLLAKSEAVYGQLQQQFIKRTVRKRYVALLDGHLAADRGVVDLPLRVDLDDRPRQMVCFEHGKPAYTAWEVVAREDGLTRVHFYPRTGRTHQLRVHAAHPHGLHVPILGDDLYGRKAGRMYLHAASLGFEHPVQGGWVEVVREPDF